MPDVVEVVELRDGQKVLHGVPDSKTQELVGMVRYQETNFDGFNRRSGQVLSRLSGEDYEKVTKRQTGVLEVSDYLKKILKRMVVNEAFSKGGLTFPEFREAFCNEACHPLDMEHLGFVGMEDFISLGVSDVLELDLNSGGFWIIVPVHEDREEESPRLNISEELETTTELIEDLKQILKKNPHGLSAEKLVEYKKNILNPSNSDKLVEVALMSPDICLVDKFQSELTFLPASFQYGKLKVNFPLHRLGDLKAEIQELLRPLKTKVSLMSVERALRGFNGNLPDPAQFGCETFVDVLQLMPEVCRLSRAGDGSYMVHPTTDGAGETVEVGDVERVKIPAEVLLGLRRMLAQYPGGVTEVELQYRRITGQQLTCPGYTDYKSLLRDLNGRQGLVWDGRRLSSSCQVRMLPVLRQEDLPSGWVEVVQVEGPDCVHVVSRPLSQELWELEKEMEEFYLQPSNVSRLRLAAGECVVGQTVAAVTSSSALHRARILETLPGLVTVLYVDRGGQALLSHSALLRLAPQFYRVPEQVVRLQRSEVRKDLAGVRLSQSEVKQDTAALRTGQLIYLGDRSQNKREGLERPRISQGQFKTEVTKFIFGLMRGKYSNCQEPKRSQG